MKPIHIDTPPAVVVYCPYRTHLRDQLIKITLSYYKRKPSSLLLECPQPQFVISQQEGRMKEEGLLFVHEGQPEKGFYLVQLVSEPKVYKGQALYPFLHGEKTLITGLPYSAYSPVDLQ